MAGHRGSSVVSPQLPPASNRSRDPLPSGCSHSSSATVAGWSTSRRPGFRTLVPRTTAPDSTVSSHRAGLKLPGSNVRPDNRPLACMPSADGWEAARSRLKCRRARGGRQHASNYGGRGYISEDAMLRLTCKTHSRRTHYLTLR